jgi:transcriptional regulator GlxA family with amidase domain
MGGIIRWIVSGGLYPAVNWVRGVRYFDGSIYSTSAGITSGIDVVLLYITQHNGDSAALAIAQKMHYPSHAHVNNPKVEQYSVDAVCLTPLASRVCNV